MRKAVSKPDGWQKMRYALQKQDLLALHKDGEMSVLMQAMSCVSGLAFVMRLFAQARCCVSCAAILR